MDFSKDIYEIMGKLEEITILDAVTQDVICKGLDNVEQLIEDCPKLELNAPATEWDFLDFSTKRFYKCNSSYIEKDGKEYIVHIHDDITQYMALNRDVTEYMAFFKKLSGFQYAVMECLSNTYYELMPMVLEYFKVEKVHFLVQRNDKMDIITYFGDENIYGNDRIAYDADMQKLLSDYSGCGEIVRDIPINLKNVFKLNGIKDNQEMRMLCVGNAHEQNYSIIFPSCKKMDVDSMGEKTIVNVIKLFIENTILREKLLYASEHDSLTGLYNKGKYLSMVEQEFLKMESIAIFNFDVNDLKVINDTYGHEAGDKLLTKAADSIRKVVNNKTFGFRMGGDEFLMVAVNVDEAEVKQIKVRWEEELSRLNEFNDGINCVIASGIAFAKAPYDFAELFKQADELMYEDKKLKKGGREIR